MQEMRIIIMQGMTCLGKSTLCKQLEKQLPRCKHYSIDTYKEEMWDKFGFDSEKQRNHQSKLARDLFYSDISEAIRNHLYDYILLDYAFTDEIWNELWDTLRDKPVSIKTVYLRPVNLVEHKDEWEKRSRDFTVRHPGHGATHYHDGKGSEYVNEYISKVFIDMHTTEEVLEVWVSFNPYSRDIPDEKIVDFIVS